MSCVPPNSGRMSKLVACGPIGGARIDAYQWRRRRHPHHLVAPSRLRRRALLLIVVRAHIAAGNASASSPGQRAKAGLLARTREMAMNAAQEYVF